MKVKFGKTKGGSGRGAMVLFYEGRWRTKREFKEKYGVGDSFINSLVSPFDNHKSKGFTVPNRIVDARLEEVRFRKMYNLNPSTPLYRHPERGLFARVNVQRNAKVTAATALKMIKCWQEGHIDDPFDVEAYEEHKRENYRISMNKLYGDRMGNEEWRKLGNVTRRENLQKIPPLTEYEKRLYHVGENR